MAPPVLLSVVVPAFNEHARIVRAIDALSQCLPELTPSWEIRIVDDGSADDTARLAETAASNDPRIVVQREPHRGKGGAVAAGMAAARGDLRFMCDADLSTPPAQISRFLAVVPATCDIAIGSREVPGARRIGEPAYRHLMGRAFNWLVRATTLAGIADTQCGFKMFSARAARLVFPLVQTSGWAFDVEVLAVARALGLRIREVPVDWRYEAVSRISPLKDTVGMTRELLAIRRRVRSGAVAASLSDDAFSEKGPRDAQHRIDPRAGIDAHDHDAGRTDADGSRER